MGSRKLKLCKCTGALRLESYFLSLHRMKRVSKNTIQGLDVVRGLWLQTLRSVHCTLINFLRHVEMIVLISINHGQNRLWSFNYSTAPSKWQSSCSNLHYCVFHKRQKLGKYWFHNTYRPLCEKDCCHWTSQIFTLFLCDY